MTFNNYLGRYGKTRLWKFGETTNLAKRKYKICKDAKEKNIRSADNFNFLEVSAMATTKAESVLIESIIRRIFEKKGYELQGNDHFKTAKKTCEVLADYHEAFTQAIRMIEVL